MNKALFFIIGAGVLAALIYFLFFNGKPSCLSVGSQQDYHFPDFGVLNLTVDLKCGSIPSGVVNYAIFENRTQTYILNGSVPFSARSAGANEKIYFNITINVSGIQLTPYWFYRAYLTLPGNIRVSNSFYAKNPDE